MMFAHCCLAYYIRVDISHHRHRLTDNHHHTEKIFETRTNKLASGEKLFASK